MTKPINFVVALLAIPVAMLTLSGCGAGTNTVVKIDEEQVLVPVPTPDYPQEVGPYDDGPGIVVRVVELLGASGPGGNFLPGDPFSVVFTLETDAGEPLDPALMTSSGLMVSGPTDNYQRVFPLERDVSDSATSNGDGTWTYVFGGPLPDVYAPPYNDTPFYGPEDGDLSGLPLLDGTYTVGIYFRGEYTVDGEDGTFREAGNGFLDFLLGDAPGIERRDVVRTDNCDSCHSDLQFHGGTRTDTRMCVLCHTSGAEDGNNPAVAGGTPGASIDFKIMIHRLHNGAHLPSVNGVTTAPDGSRDYSAAPQPYLIIGRNDSIHDYSNIHFPVWPNLSSPMPRDMGYSSLTPGQQSSDDEMRRGVTDCSKCHGDPDGNGPKTAPSQGNLAYSQPSQNVCGSCHDDVIWDLPYRANGVEMPANSENGSCSGCHPSTGSDLAVMNGHRHPLVDPAINPGLNFTVENLVESGAADMDGTLDPGEKVAVTFRVTADSGAPADPADYGNVSYVISGPTSNYNLVVNEGFSSAVLAGPQPYTLNLPQGLLYEFVGTSTAAPGETFFTSRAPIWAGSVTVNIRSGTLGGDSVLDAPAAAQQNYLDLLDATGFDRDDYVVIDDGVAGREEYLRIQTVEGNRIWFSSPYTRGYGPGVRMAHSAGASAREVSVTELVEGVDYSVNLTAASITELVEFGSVAVLVDYTTDFIMPGIYPLSLNSSPEIDETWGKWTGKSLVAGTYSFGMWSNRSLVVDDHGESQTYRGTSPNGGFDFLVGSASTHEPYDRISSGETCNSCHNDIYFHGGGRRGFDTCILCHGTAGAEDRAEYVAANATNTPRVLVTFKRMLHKIHFGAELSQPYEVDGFGLGYPDNFRVHTYDEVEFPAMPDGAQECTKCHGDGNTAWHDPNDASHPTEQGSPARPWRTACLSCHDSIGAAGHAEAQSPGGVEACVVCHGALRAEDVVRVHFPR